MTDTAQDTAAPPAERKPAFETIDLAEPIVRGETNIEQLTLRGLTLTDVIGIDIATILKLIPRISEPVLTDDECQNLDPADLNEIGGAIRGFFMTKAERQLLEAMLADYQPKT